MAKHSTILGGSTSERLLQCAASFQAVQMLPPVLADTPSIYAEYGTALHVVMERLMSTYEGQLVPPIATLIKTAQTYIATTFHDRELTQEHIDEAIAPALEGMKQAMDRFGGGFSVAATEMRVKFPGVAGAFGTADILLINKTHALLGDYKFGAGVPVKAVYSDEYGDTLNAQAMFYLAGAMHTAPKLFVKRKLAVVILQPRAQEDPCTYTEVQRVEVHNFIEDIENAVIAALDRDPKFNKGRWCRWCPAKVACPLWTGPMQELIELIGIPVEPTPPTHDITPYAVYLAHAKRLVDLAVVLKKDIDGQMHQYLESGGMIPGWHLKLKPKMRQWADDAIVEEGLRKLGFAPIDIFRQKLVTFESADATARRLRVKIPAELRPTPPSTETTLATDTDEEPIIDRHLAVEQFAAAFEELKAG